MKITLALSSFFLSLALTASTLPSEKSFFHCPGKEKRSCPNDGK
ncbi:hypothetical protein [Leptospira ryugenii]|nr:hypothetical protein [Leptospira ryugenii]